MIYSKRGTWYLKEEGKNIKAFISREAAEAKESRAFSSKEEAEAHAEPISSHKYNVKESLEKVNSEYPGTLKELDDGGEEEE